MAGSSAFEWLCTALEESTTLERLEARGTVRIALKEAGLEPRTVTPGELRVVVQKIMPRELRNRGVAERSRALRPDGRGTAGARAPAR